MTEWFNSEQKLVKDYSHAPYINLIKIKIENSVKNDVCDNVWEKKKKSTERASTYLLSDLRVLRLVKTFGRLVPVSADALACQLDFVLVFFNDLA